MNKKPNFDLIKIPSTASRPEKLKKVVDYIDNYFNSRDFVKQRFETNGKHDWNARARTNVIGAITDSQFDTTCLFKANINSGVFYAWLTNDLLPKLSK